MDTACHSHRRTTVCYSNLSYILLHLHIPTSRINIQDQVRRLIKEPREEDRKEIEQLRERLTPQLDLLDELCFHATEGRFSHDPTLQADDPSAFDDMDDEDTPNQGNNIEYEDELGGPTTRACTAATATAAGSATTGAAGMSGGHAAMTAVGPPEKQKLSIPSTWISASNQYRAVELQLRMKQASKSLQALRDAIADKSFQYSHVIRVAPKKGVRTRARATIAKLNYIIAFQSRVYTHCRAAMTRLGAEDAILDKFQILSKEHVKSSSALLNPNEPGSTRLQLSWIWQTGSPGTNGTPAALQECKSCNLNTWCWCSTNANLLMPL